MKGLVLEGGGAKGSFGAGAIKAFNKKKIYFDAVVGTSIGSINGAFYASKNTKDLFKLWQEIESKDLFGFDNSFMEDIYKGKIDKIAIKNGIKDIFKIIQNKGIDISNIRNYLNKYINEEDLKKSNIDFGLVTYNITDKKPVEIFKKDIPKGKLTDYIIASSYLPIFKFEKIIDDKYYLDGGVHSNIPIHMIINKGYEEIYVVRAWRNKVILPKNKNTKVHVITPKKSLGLVSVFSPETAKENFKYGYFETLKYIDKLDGKEYYFKHYDKNYYNKLFDKDTLKEMIKKYSHPLLVKNHKDFIINIIENICKEFNIKKYKIHNIPYLITIFKSKLLHKDTIYKDFIKKIKIVF